MALAVLQQEHGMEEAQPFQYTELCDVIRRFASSFEDSRAALHELRQLLNNHQEALLQPNPFGYKPKSEGDRQKVQSGSVKVGGTHHQLTDAMKQEVLKMSDELDLNELECATYYVWASDEALRSCLLVQLKLPESCPLADNVSFIARQMWMMERLNLLAGLRDLLKLRLARKLPTDRARLLDRACDGLLRKGLPAELMGTLRALKGAIGVDGGPAEDPSAQSAPTPPGREKAEFANSVRWLAADCLFYICYHTQLTDDEATELVTLLREYSDQLGLFTLPKEGQLDTVGQWPGGQVMLRGPSEGGRYGHLLQDATGPRSPGNSYMASLFNVTLALAAALASALHQDKPLRDRNRREDDPDDDDDDNALESDKPRNHLARQQDNVFSPVVATLQFEILEKGWGHKQFQGLAALCLVQLLWRSCMDCEAAFRPVVEGCGRALELRAFSFLRGPILAAVRAQLGREQGSEEFTLQVLGDLLHQYLSLTCTQGLPTFVEPSSRRELLQDQQTSTLSGMEMARRLLGDCLDEVLVCVGDWCEADPGTAQELWSAVMQPDGPESTPVSVAHMVANTARGVVENGDHELLVPLFQLLGGMAAAGGPSARSTFRLLQDHDKYNLRNYLESITQSCQPLRQGFHANAVGAYGAGGGQQRAVTTPPRMQPYIDPATMRVLEAFVGLLRRLLHGSADVAKEMLADETAPDHAAAGALVADYRIVERMMELATLPLAPRIKGEVFKVLAACAKHAPDKIWRELQARQVIPSPQPQAAGPRQPPPSSGGMRGEVAAEAGAGRFPATEGFCCLMQELFLHHMPYDIAPGPVPYLVFLLEDVLLPVNSRQYADPSEKWRIVARVLQVFLIVLRRYPVGPDEDCFTGGKPETAKIDAERVRRDFEKPADRAALRSAHDGQAQEGPESGGYLLMMQLLRRQPLLDFLIGVLVGDRAGVDGVSSLREDRDLFPTVRALMSLGSWARLTAAEQRYLMAAGGGRLPTADSDRASSGENWVWWRERSATLALALLQAAVVKQEPFIRRMRGMPVKLAGAQDHAEAPPRSSELAPLSYTLAGGNYLKSPLLSIARYLDYRPNLSLSLMAVSVVRAVSRSLDGPHLLASLKELDEDNVFMRAMVSRLLERAGVGGGEADTSTGLVGPGEADVDFTEVDPGLLGLQVYDPLDSDAEAQEPITAPYHWSRKIRQGLMQLLIECLDDSGANLSLWLLGLLKPPGAEPRRPTACLYVVVDQLHDPNFWDAEPRLTYQSYALLHKLCGSSRMGPNVLDGLMQMHFIPSQLQMVLANPELLGLRDTTYAPLRCRTLALLFRCVALELQLRHGQSNRAPRHAVDMLVEIFGIQTEDTARPQPGGLLKLLEQVPFEEDPPEGWAQYLRDEKVRRCVRLEEVWDNGPRLHFIDEDCLRRELPDQPSPPSEAHGRAPDPWGGVVAPLLGVGLVGHGGMPELGNALIPAPESARAAALMEWVKRWNHHAEGLRARGELCQAWAQLLEIAVLVVKPIADGQLLWQQLRGVLQKLKQNPSAHDALRLPLSHAAAVLLTALGTMGRRAMVGLQDNGAEPGTPEWDPPHLELLLTTLQEFGSQLVDQQIRTNLYTALLQYLQLTNAAHPPEEGGAPGQAAFDPEEEEAERQEAEARRLLNLNILERWVPWLAGVAAQDAADIGPGQCAALALLATLLGGLNRGFLEDMHLSGDVEEDPRFYNELSRRAFSKGLQALDQPGYLGQMVDSLPAKWQRPGKQEVLCAMTLFTCIAGSPEGAQTLLGAGLVPKLSACLAQAQGASPRDWQEQWLLPQILKLVQALSSSLPGNKQLAAQVLDLIGHNDKKILSVLCALEHQPTLQAMHTVCDVVGVLAHAACHKDLFEQRLCREGMSGRAIHGEVWSLLATHGAYPYPPRWLDPAGGRSRQPPGPRGTWWEGVVPETDRERQEAAERCVPPPHLDPWRGHPPHSWTHFEARKLEANVRLLCHVMTFLRHRPSLETDPLSQAHHPLEPGRVLAQSLDACAQVYVVNTRQLGVEGAGQYGSLPDDMAYLVEALLVTVYQQASSLQVSQVVELMRPSLNQLKTDPAPFIRQVARTLLQSMPAAPSYT